MALKFSVLIPYLGQFFDALILTIILSVSAFVISALLAALLLPLRVSENRILRSIVWAYVEVLRNVPILIVLYVVFFGLPRLGIFTDLRIAAIVALSFNSTAYLVEIYRGGLQAVPKAHYEAADALSVRGLLLWRKILIPQALRVSFPAIGNQLAACVLGSSLAVLIGARELTGMAYSVGSTTFRYFEVFIFIAIIYFLLVQVVDWLWRKLGHKFLIRTQAA